MSLETLKTRIDYLGGDSLDRIKQQKLKSFYAALGNDYNSRLILTPFGENFRALINDNNTKSDYDKRYISVDYAAQLSPGDVFECIDDNTHWMIYLQDLVEIAYFKAEIVRCRYQIQIDDQDYWIYFQGPTETTIRWNLKRDLTWNDLNFSGTVYIQRNKQTQEYFNRFDKIKIDGHTWQVKVVDTLTVPGIIELEVQEYFDSLTEDLVKTHQINIQNDIFGLQEVYPYEIYQYNIKDTTGEFSISNNKARILSQTDGQCQVEILSGKKGNFNLIYTTENKQYTLPITILSL